MAVKPRGSSRRVVRRPTPDYLANAALYYLSRYAASESSLRRVLENKIRRAIAQDETFAQDHAAHEALRRTIETIIETHKASGVINDAAFAEMKVHSLRRAGRSARMISQKLSQKGIKQEHIVQALIPEDDEEPREVDLRAAMSFAKRRALGPFRKTKTTALDAQALAKQKNKDVSTLARAGFPFDIIKEVLGTEIEEVADFL